MSLSIFRLTLLLAIFIFPFAFRYVLISEINLTFSKDGYYCSISSLAYDTSFSNCQSINLKILVSKIIFHPVNGSIDKYLYFRKQKFLLIYSPMNSKEIYSWILFEFKHLRLRKTNHMKDNSLRCFRGRKSKKFVRMKYNTGLDHLLSLMESIPKYAIYGIDLAYAFLKYGKQMKDILKISEIIIKKG